MHQTASQSVVSGYTARRMTARRQDVGASLFPRGISDTRNREGFQHSAARKPHRDQQEWSSRLRHQFYIYDGEVDPIRTAIFLGLRRDFEKISETRCLNCCDDECLLAKFLLTATIDCPLKFLGRELGWNWINFIDR